MAYSYRIHIKLPKDKGFLCHEKNFEINDSKNFRSIKVKASDDSESISKSTDLFFISNGFANEEEAEREGNKVLNTIIRSFVSLKKGIDFGARGSTFHITKIGLEHFQKKFGFERVMEGGLGLRVYKTYPPPRFAQIKVSPKVLTPVNKFHNTFKKAEQKYRELTQKEVLSIQLFNSSFFEEVAESRFLLLVMAIEILIICNVRSKEVNNHVKKLIELTKNNNEIEEKDKDSIVGSLAWLKTQSIGQAGRELAKNKLGGNKYHNMSAEKFFNRIYSVRSNLVHGNSDQSSLENIGKLSIELEKFVSDLLTGEIN